MSAGRTGMESVTLLLGPVTASGTLGSRDVRMYDVAGAVGVADFAGDGATDLAAGVPERNGSANTWSGIVYLLTGFGAPTSRLPPDACSWDPAPWQVKMSRGWLWLLVPAAVTLALAGALAAWRVLTPASGRFYAFL